MTKTRTKTKTSTATAVALGTVGLAALAAAALAFNFQETNNMIPGTGTTVPAPSGTTVSVAPGTVTAGTPLAPADRGVVAVVPNTAPGMPITGVVALTAASCRSNPKNFPDLSLGTGVVTRAGFGTTRGAVLIQMLNNTDKRAEAFALKCIEQLANGRWQELGSFPQPFLEGRRQRTQSVEYSPTATKVQCFVDAADQVVETNECNNIKDFSVAAPI